jgi:two-component system alkaline phosphatase synthesis response regulator PhoP
VVAQQPMQSGAIKQGLDVLLVDDNEQNIELLSAFLEDFIEQHGGRIRTAPDGLEAIKLIETVPPDLILLDVMMPRMSGFQLCSRLKQSPTTRKIPIVMVTALTEVSDVERATECGADDFISKPVNRVELIGRIRGVLSRPIR